MSELLLEHKVESGQVIQVREGNIVTEQCDVIVNAANSQLKHNGGVARAISEAGGHLIQYESDKWVKQVGEVEVGSVAVTTGGMLSCAYIYHAVGPVWGNGSHTEDFDLARVITRCLMMAQEMPTQSIAFPAISSGIFRMPKEVCAKVFIETILQWFKCWPHSAVREVRLVNIDTEMSNAFLNEINKLQ